MGNRNRKSHSWGTAKIAVRRLSPPPGPALVPALLATRGKSEALSFAAQDTRDDTEKEIFFMVMVSLRYTDL